MSGIRSRLIAPLPPTPLASRHEALSRRNRRSGKLSFPNSLSNGPSIKQSSKILRKESVNGLKTTAYNCVLCFRKLGLQVEPKRMVWLEWEPGEEYTQYLNLQNNSLELLKIQYFSPTTLFFSTLFPYLIILSPGTSVTLPVTFRPLKKEVYEDQLSFTSQIGSFSIPLQGLFHQYSIHLPDSIHFGLSAINLCGQLTFKLQNTSELVTNFSWNVPKPFQILPMDGVLMPKSSCDLNASFFPTSAAVCKVTAVCTYGVNLNKSLTLDGIGKFPYIVASADETLMSENHGQKPVVNFQVVNVHQGAHNNVVLHNVTNVAADFTISLIPKMVQVDNAFSLEKKSGLLAAMKKEKISITYSPHMANVRDTARYQVSIAGGITTTDFYCVGTSEGPNVIVSETLIDFGLLHPKEVSLIKTLKITNLSNCDAIFQFDLDDSSGTFCVDITCGILPRRKVETIEISFEPTNPINYYRRAVLLVHEQLRDFDIGGPLQSESHCFQGPIFIDLIGTKHSKDIMPPVLLPEHLLRYWTFVARGLSFYSPHFVQSQLKEEKLALDDSGVPFVVEEANEKYKDKPVTSPMQEYFDDGHYTETTINPPHVSLDQNYIWMGRVESHTWSTTVRLNNHTAGKVLATWVPDDGEMFKVLPPVAEVLPFKGADFKILFQFEAPDQYVSRQLECYVSYKSLRDYRIVSSMFVIPPWLLTVDIVGHTCGKNKAIYPTMEVHKQNLVFPAVLPENSSFRTVVVENKGLIPTLYHITKGQQDIVAKPPFGVSASKYQISIIRFTPEKVGIFRDKLTVRFNDDEKHDKIIEVIGTGEQPELLMQNGGEMYFKPTCVHSVTTNDYDIENISRSSLQFKWLISKEYQHILSVDPPYGVISPKEIQRHKWSFTPTRYGDFQLIVFCLAWRDNLDVSGAEAESAVKDVKKFKLKVVAESIRGEIRVERGSIDFGSILVGSAKTDSLVLYNDFHCDLHFRLHLKQVIDNEYGEESNSKEPMQLKLSLKKAVVPGRSRLAIQVQAHAHRRVYYTWLLYCEQLTSAGRRFPSSKQTLLCQIAAEGIFPTLQVVDVRSTDKGKAVSRGQLWKWLNIDNLNLCLDYDPNPAELALTVNMKRRSSFKSSVYTDSVVTFHFGAAPLAAQSCFVSLTLKNTSSVACDWAFLFPDDLQMNLDPWAIDGLMTPGELHVTLVESNKLFTVHPKQGVINPDEKCVVIVSYKHDVVGTHRIPVLFKIDKGKEVLLEFVGLTVEHGRRYLHFTENHHNFAPICIGEPMPPKQIYELHNCGSLPVSYYVELSPLKDLEDENFDQKIFTCLNPAGTIPPETSLPLEWVFAPFESKTYRAKIPIHVIDGDTATITFEGSGYDRRHMGESEPMLDRSFCDKLATKIEERLLPPEQILRLSSEYICFGNVPVYARVRQVIFLTNTSEVTSVYFSWNAISDVANKVVIVMPTEGTILPGHSAMCTVVFCGASSPSFFDVTLICEVVDLTKKADYAAELKAWKEECEEQAVEFCITSKTELLDQYSSKCSSSTGTHSKASNRVSKIEHLENPLNKTSEPHLVESEPSDCSFPVVFKKFQTLPPIKMDTSYGQRSLHESLQKHHDLIVRKDWVRPRPPKPTIVQLTVTARTHNADVYRQLFPVDCYKYFLDRTMQSDVAEQTLFSTELDLHDLKNCCDNEQMMVKMTLAETIQGLLNDKTFQDSVCKLDEMLIPFFGQLPRDSNFGEAFPQLSVLFMDEEATEIERRLKTPLVSEVLQQNVTASNAASSPELSGRVPKVSSTLLKKEEVKVFKDLSEEKLKVQPNFEVILDDILSEVVGNIMVEALHGEVVLTTRPRIVALPPSDKVESCIGVPKLENRPKRPRSAVDTKKWLDPSCTTRHSLS